MAPIPMPSQVPPFLSLQNSNIVYILEIFSSTTLVLKISALLPIAF